MFLSDRAVSAVRRRTFNLSFEFCKTGLGVEIKGQNINPLVHTVVEFPINLKNCGQENQSLHKEKNIISDTYTVTKERKSAKS